MSNSSRVKKLKSILIFGPYVVVLIPIILCIALFVMAGVQNRQLKIITSDLVTLKGNQDTLVEMINAVSDSMNDLSGEVSELSKDVKEIKSYRHVAIPTTEHDGEIWPKKVYLTFDDGPSINTEKILAILDKYGVKGNFFVVGTQSEDLKKEYKRIVDDGHVLAIHSYSHKYSEIYASKEAFINDLDKISELLYEETGTVPKIYRFPGGSSNNVSRVPMPELIQVLKERGMVYYDWNVLSGDATNPIPSTDTIVANSLDSIGEYEEAMILFHDLSNKTTTVEALPIIIESLIEQDIPIATIDDTTMAIQHDTNN